MRRRLLACIAGVATVSALGAASPRAAPASPPVLLVGDSVATGMLWHPPAVAAMQEGLAVDWQVAICRTIDGTSCPFDGERPPTLLELLDTMPSVPPLVVVELGYNDEPDAFPGSLDAAMKALLAHGAEHVLWLTLHAVQPPYPDLNADLEQAARRWPELELVDWNTFAAGHYTWFQSDGLHLLDSGGLAMAHLVHAAVMRIVDPLHPVTRPEDLRPGREYRLALRATGGAAPYRWAVAAGRPPRGFHLLADGRLTVRAPRGTHARVIVAVTDADGTVADLRLDVG